MLGITLIGVGAAYLIGMVARGRPVDLLPVAILFQVAFVLVRTWKVK